MSKKMSLALGAALALVLSGSAFAESAEKLEKAHEKAETSLQTMDTKEAEKMQKAHEESESSLKTMDSKEAEKLEKAHDKSEEHLEKIESK